MKLKAFITHKLAEEYQDCQDRFIINSNTKSVAVSDGMSQSIFPHFWAELLVETFVNKTDWVPNHESAKELSFDWRKRVDDRIEEIRQQGKHTWRVENNLAVGKSAGATFLGIRFEDNSWKGDVLGDSCLITIDPKNMIKSIFTSQEGAFDNHPDHFDSNPSSKGKGTPREISGILNSGDKLLLVSDPFTDYLAKRKDEEDLPNLIEELLKLENHDQFCTLVDIWREQGMHNDDSTLVMIEFDGKPDFTIIYQDNLQLLIETEQKRTEELKKNTVIIDSEDTQAEVFINSKTEDTSIIVTKIESEKDTFQELLKQINDLLYQIKSGFKNYSATEIKKIKKTMPELLDNLNAVRKKLEKS